MITTFHLPRQLRLDLPLRQDASGRFLPWIIALMVYLAAAGGVMLIWLGDALHNMTPFRGMGANAALYDAQLLRNALVAVDRGEAALNPALAHCRGAFIAGGYGTLAR